MLGARYERSTPHDPASVRVGAGREFSRRLAALLAAGDSVVIESTLAGASLSRSLARARSAGYELTIVLVFLDSPELCLRRIAGRVAQGGHDVPEQDVRRRSLRVFPVFWRQYRQQAERCLIVFNGGASFAVVAEAEQDNWVIYDDQLWATFQSFLLQGNDEDNTA